LGGAAQKKVEELKPMRPPWFRHYEPTQHLVLLDILFELFQVKVVLFANSPLFIFISVSSQIYFCVVMHVLL